MTDAEIYALSSIVINEVKQGNEKYVYPTLRENIQTSFRDRFNAKINLVLSQIMAEAREIEDGERSYNEYPKGQVNGLRTAIKMIKDLV